MSESCWYLFKLRNSIFTARKVIFPSFYHYFNLAFGNDEVEAALFFHSRTIILVIHCLNTLGNLVEGLVIKKRNFVH